MRDSVVYDGDCGVCAQLAGFLIRRIRPRGMDVVASRDADLGALRLTPDECAAALQWVETSGRRSSAGQAVIDCLRHCPHPWRAVGMIANTEPLRGVWLRTYPVLARNRHRWPFAPTRCPRPGGEPRR